MKNQIRTILCFAVLLNSCTHYYYVANIQNVPLFKEKNELRFSGSLGGGDESTCIEAQAAYSLTDKIGLMANYMYAKGGDIPGKNYGKGNYFEGGAGYYKPIGEDKVFEIYGGIGGGSQYHEYSGTLNGDYEGNAEFSLINFYVQPSFGFTYNFLDVAGSARFCRVSYTSIDNQVSMDLSVSDEINSLSDKPCLYLEPAITLRGGWKYIKFQVQASYAANINSPRIYIGEEAHISAGLYFTIAERLKKKVINPESSAFK